MYFFQNLISNFFNFWGLFKTSVGKWVLLKVFLAKARKHRDKNRRRYDVVVVVRWRLHMARLTIG
jgi:hypothetical protein